MILFVAAESREFQGLLRHLRHKRRLAWPVQYAVEAQLSDRQVVLVAGGPGPHLAGQAARIAEERITVEAMVSTGFCGALDPAIEVGAIVVPSEIIDLQGCTLSQVTPLNNPAHIVNMKLLSMDRVAVSSQEKLELHQTGASAVEMESAAVAAQANAWQIPFYCIRVVTDTADERFSIDFNRMRDSSGRFSRYRIIKTAIQNPRKLFPELMRFKKRCDRGAAILGDFIADCRF